MTDESLVRAPLSGERLAYRASLFIAAQTGDCDALLPQIERLVAEAAMAEGAAVAPGAITVDGWDVVRCARARAVDGDAVRLVTAVRACECGVDVSIAARCVASPAALDIAVQPAVRLGSRLAGAIVTAFEGSCAWYAGAVSELIRPRTQALAVAPDNLQELFDAIGAPYRTAPLAIVASLADGSWPVRPDDIAASLAGLATVLCLDFSDAVLKRALNLLPGARALAPAPGKMALYAPVVLDEPPLRAKAFSKAQTMQSLETMAAQASRWNEALLSRTAYDPCQRAFADDALWGGEAL